MKIGLFFSPISKTLLPKYESTLGACVEAFTETPPNWKNADIVILGVPEYRGASETNNDRKDIDQIRKAFYQQKSNQLNPKIVDIGDLKEGITLEDTYLRLQETVNSLIQENCLPIILGGSHDLTYGQYQGYVALEQFVHLINVDSQLDLGISNRENISQSFLENIFIEKRNYLFGYSHLGHHSFLTDTDELKILEQIGFECIRIGELKGKIQETEPIIRNGNFMSFDINAIRASDSPCSSSPFGFSAEESCQMMWYAGQHNQMSSLGLYGYSSDKDLNHRSAQIYATMMWYFIEGFYCRKGSTSIFDSNYTKYIVSFELEDISFYKDNLTDKWWLEVANPVDNQKFKRNSLIPCSHADYQDATKGKIPDRWIQAQSKLS